LPATNGSPAIDQPVEGGYGYLWDYWKKERQWQSDLYRKAAHKSLDIPEDPMGINAPKTTVSGMGWKELLVLAAAGLGGFYLYDRSTGEPASPPAAVDTDTDTTTEYLIKPLPGE
jgi:hypothetical protein